MNEFEYLKRTFGLDVPPETFQLSLIPRTGRRDCKLPYYDPSGNELILSKKDVQNLFDPVISKIVALVNSQIIAASQTYGSPVINVGAPPANQCGNPSSLPSSSESSLLAG